MADARLPEGAIGGAAPADPPPAPSAAALPLRVVRVKRKRDVEAPDDLIVEGLAAPAAKRLLHEALSGLGLAPGASAGAEAAAAPAARFRRVSTLSAAQLGGLSAEALDALLRAGRKRGAGSDDAAAPPQPAARRKAARYEQVRRVRGLTLFERTEAAPDPLRAARGVYDVVAHGAEEAPPAPASPTAAAAAAAEEALLCNYMPMVREYLAASGGGGSGGGGSAARSTAAATGATEADEGAEGGDGDYVYDLYVPGEESAAGGGGAGAEGDAGADEAAGWWELHRAGTAPAVRVVDDGLWLVEEAPDAPGSGGSGGDEDSNAEGHYANSYPDEDAGGSSSDAGSWSSSSASGSEGGARQRRHRGGAASEEYGSGDEY
jgi:hypothetical protein